MSNLTQNLKDLFNFFSGKPTFVVPKDVPTDQFPENNTGIIEGKQDGDYDVVAGNSPIPYQIVLPSGDWRPFMVKGEWQFYQPMQYSPPVRVNAFDTMACTDYSNNNCAEIALKQNTGLEFNFSDRALSVLSGTTKQGNYLSKVADVGRNVGRILESDYSDDGAVNWEDYNKPLSADLLKRAYRFNEAYQWVATDKASMQYHLKQAPIQIIINNATHAVCCVFVDENGWWYMDSYDPFLKRTTVQPTSALQLIIKPITQFVHVAGTGEYGFYVGAPSVEDLRNKGMLLGMPVVQDDGSIPFAKAREISLK